MQGREIEEENRLMESVTTEDEENRNMLGNAEKTYERMNINWRRSNGRRSEQKMERKES